MKIIKRIENMRNRTAVLIYGVMALIIVGSIAGGCSHDDTKDRSLGSDHLQEIYGQYGGTSVGRDRANTVNFDRQADALEHIAHELSMMRTNCSEVK